MLVYSYLFQLAESVGQMADLISFTTETRLGPMGKNMQI